MPVLFSFFCLVPSPLKFYCQRPFVMAPIREAQEQLSTGHPGESRILLNLRGHFVFLEGKKMDNSRGVFSK